MPLVASAQQPAVAEGLAAVGPGKFAGVVEAKVTLVVDSIDKASRSLVLKDDKGEQSKFVVGDQAKNFDQIKVGDLVVISYTQELLMTLVKGGGQLRERIDSGQQGMAAPGQMPGAFESKEVAFVADVQQVDRKNQTSPCAGAVKTVTLKIKDPEQLKLINKGDQVEGVFCGSHGDRRRPGTAPRRGNRVTKVSPRCAGHCGGCSAIDAASGTRIECVRFWGHSSAGRASGSQSEGRRFDPACLHNSQTGWLKRRRSSSGIGSIFRRLYWSAMRW
jgi:hypothetical protein